MHSKSVHLEGVKMTNTTTGVSKKKTGGGGGGRKKPLALKESIKNKIPDVSKNIICSKNKRVQEKKSTSLDEHPDCDRFLHDHNKCIRSVFWLDEGNLSDLYQQIGFTPHSPS